MRDYSELESRAALPAPQTSAPQPAANDPYAELVARSQAAPASTPASTQQQTQETAVPEGAPGIGELAAHEASGMGASAIAGIRSVWDLAHGRALADIDADNQKFIAAHTYEPRTQGGKAATQAYESNYNPLNWPSLAIDKLGEGINKITGSTVAGPVTAGALKLGMQAAPVIAGARAVSAPRVEPQALAEAPEVAPAATAVDSPPVEGGVPSEAVNGRAAVLKRIGLDNARKSALEGNAQNAATDFQMTKFDEPAGVAAKAQFDSERAALQQHAEETVSATGGSLGTDEDSLHIRGQAIAKPFDELQDWFQQKRTQLYDAANQRSGGTAVVQPYSLGDLLGDQSLKNQLTARNQTGLLSGVSAELERFKQANGGALTVQQAEQFRQFLNTLWTPETSNVLGRFKAALDDDVMKGAGEDMYGPARQLAQQKYQMLDNPNGVAKLLEKDPQTPINRVTPYVKIPDTVTRLDPDQFANVIQTLRNVPAEVQPSAQSALAEIKAHLANKVLDAGNSTRGQWNAAAVDKTLRANSAKMGIAFQDQPEVAQRFNDLNSAGKILSVNQSYPGAAAQAANAMKRGLLTQAMTQGGRLLGAGAGAMSGMGPLVTAGATVGGETLGRKAGAALSERAAVSKWNRGVKKLSDVVSQ